MPASPIAARARDVASPLHTAALITLIVAVAVTGTIVSGAGAPGTVAPASPIAAYVPLLVVQWGLVFYVCALGGKGRSLSSLLGRRWRWGTWRRACGDLALALAVMALVEGIESAWVSATNASRSASVATMIPATAWERAAWLFVSASVGFCEEVVYRGYLQTQLTAFTRRVSWGVCLQALLFGIAHADQGIASAVRVAIYGAILGVVANARRSLIPGIVAHTGIDLAAGFA
ncbi:MAG TPA: CPBP family intramembrane glutamic endopeptidase [Polyangiaceae bacterium]